MDGEILSERLAATESAVIALDEKVDEIEDETVAEEPVSAPILDHEGRIATLEERLSQCLMTLQTLQEQTAIAQSEAQTAMAIAVDAEEAAMEPEPMPLEEPSLETEVQEVEPESENEDAPSEPPKKWWESLLTLR